MDSDIFKAAAEGNLYTLRAAARKKGSKAALFERNSQMLTPLQIACQHGHAEVAEFLFHLRPSSRPKATPSRVSRGMSDSDDDAVDGEQINNPDGTTWCGASLPLDPSSPSATLPLAFAAASRSAVVVKAVLARDQGETINSRDDGSLGNAGARERLDFNRTSLPFKLPRNEARGSDFKDGLPTPSAIARERCYPYGAEDSDDDDDRMAGRVDDGPTPIMIAASTGCWDVFYLLWRAKGCDLMLASRYSNVLLEAARGGNAQIVERLLDFGRGRQAKRAPDESDAAAAAAASGAVHQQPEDITVHWRAPLTGRTALHAAASVGSTEMIDLLIRRGADINARDNGGLTSLFAAAGSPRAFSLLLSYGSCDVSVISVRGLTVLEAFIAAMMDVHDATIVMNMDSITSGVQSLLECLPKELFNRLSVGSPLHSIGPHRPPLLQVLTIPDAAIRPFHRHMSRALMRHRHTDVSVGTDSGLSVFELATTIVLHRGEAHMAAEDASMAAFEAKGAARRQPEVLLKSLCQRAVLLGDAVSLEDGLRRTNESDPDALQSLVPGLALGAKSAAARNATVPRIDTFVQLYFQLPVMPPAGVLEVLIRHGANINALCKPRCPLLMAAISAPDQTLNPSAPVDAALLLIRSGACVNPDLGFYSLLGAAINRKRLTVASALVEWGCDVDGGVSDHIEALANDVAAIRRSVASTSTFPSVPRLPGASAARYCTAEQRAAIEAFFVELEVTAMASVSNRLVTEGEGFGGVISCGIADLMSLAGSILAKSRRERDVAIDSLSMSHLLLTNGSSVNELEWLEGFEKGRPLVFRFLDKKNPHASSSPNYFRNTFYGSSLANGLYWGTDPERVKAFQLALDNGMAVDGTDDRGTTPMAYAIKNGWYALARLLLINGAAATKAEEHFIKKECKSDYLWQYGIFHVGES